MKKILLNFFGALMIISLIWSIQLYVKNGRISVEDVKVGQWYAILNDMEFPSMYDKFISLFNVFKNNISNGLNYISYSFKALGDSTSILGLLKAYWNLWKSLYNLLLQPVVFTSNLTMALFEWLYYLLLIVGKMLVFIFAPWLDYSIQV